MAAKQQAGPPRGIGSRGTEARDRSPCRGAATPWALVGGLLLLVLGGSLAFFAFRHADPVAESRRAGESLQSPPRPRAQPDPPMHPPTFVPPERIDSWPDVPADKRALLEEGRRLLGEASRLYAEGRPQTIALGDERMVAALDALFRAGAVVPELRAYHHEVALRPLRADDTARADELVRFWLRSFPQDAFALDLLGRLRFNSRAWSAAADLFGRVLEQRPRDLEALRLNARARFQMRQWARTVQSARAAVELGDPGPERTEDLRLLAEAAYELGDSDTGLTTARALLDAVGYPDTSTLDRAAGRQSLLTAIKVLHRFRSYELLREVAAFWRTRHTDDLQATGAEGIARRHTGDSAGAIPLLEAALEDESNRGEVRFELGRAFFETGRHREAARQFAGVLVDDPQDSKAHYQLGLVLGRLERPDDAAALFARSRELAPSERESRRARELAGAGKPVASAVASARAAWLRLDLRAAEQALREPSLRYSLDARRALVDILIDSLRPAAAREVLAVKPPSGQPDFSPRERAVIEARAEWSSGERQTALRALEALGGAKPLPEATQWMLAEWHIDVGQPRRALEILEPLRRSAEDRVASRLAAEAHLALGEYAQALRLLRSISSGDTRWHEWEMSAKLAFALAGTGDEDAARRELDRIPERRRGTLPWSRARQRIESATQPDGPAKAALDIALAARDRILAARTLVARSAPDASGPARHALAEELRASGDIGDAIRELRAAVALDSDDVGGLRKLSEWLDRREEVYLRIHILEGLTKFSSLDLPTMAALAELKPRWVTFDE